MLYISLKICKKTRRHVTSLVSTYASSHDFITLKPFSNYINYFVRTYVIHLLGTYVTILCNWLIL